MKCAAFLGAVLTLAACAQQPKPPVMQIVSSHVTSSSEPGGSWRVRCTGDHHGTAPQQCFAQTEDDDRGMVSLTVYYIDGRGPYVQTGDDPDRNRPIVVRVDDRPIRTTEHAQVLIEDFLRGQKAYITYYKWPYEDHPFKKTFTLAGFPAAWSKLQQLLKSPSA